MNKLRYKCRKCSYEFDKYFRGGTLPAKDEFVFASSECLQCGHDYLDILNTTPRAKK